MVSIQQGGDRRAETGSSAGLSTWKTMVLVLAVGVMAGIGYLMFKAQGSPTRLLAPRTSSTQTEGTPANSQAKPVPSDMRLTREGIDGLLNALDEATRHKDVDRVVRHIAPDASITIHMMQGSHQQMALLTREEYRKTLAMAFAFPSANDFTRTNTSVSLAADERSAKVSFKSTETLLQANREFKTEGEETLVVHVRDGKPMITSLEQTFPGDST
ncbi:MAG: nuclear transport factor 2 family protein [Nitrospira sp.]|nr:nuclear transport factor 2 family protein [Nitrospira sp.]